MAKKEQEKKPAAFNIPIFTPENKTKLENFYEKYRNQGAIVLAVIVVLLSGFYIYKNVYLKNQSQEAYSLMFNAENYLEMDSFRLALEGNFQNDEYGFLDIVDEYGMTEAGKLAAHYSGVCYLNLGEPEEALDYLKKYNPSSKTMRAVNYGLRGDAHSELEEYEEAAKWYLKAAKFSDNELTTPLFYWKAGLNYEKVEEYQKAIDAYQIVKDKYPSSNEGNKIDKYIGRAEEKLAQ